MLYTKSTFLTSGFCTHQTFTSSWCKTIVTTIFCITSYNCFALRPQNLSQLSPYETSPISHKLLFNFLREKSCIFLQIRTVFLLTMMTVTHLSTY